MIRIAGLRKLSDRLARLDMTDSQNIALDHAAQLLQKAIQQSLSISPGSDHATPWRRTGSLQSSIGYRSDATRATIGSDDPVAIDQEFGTRTVPPRPFLSPSAAAHAEEIACQISESIVAVIHDAIKDNAP